MFSVFCLTACLYGFWKKKTECKKRKKVIQSSFSVSCLTGSLVKKNLPLPPLYVHVCACVRALVHVCVRECGCVDGCGCGCECGCVYMCVCVCLCVCVCVCLCWCVCVCVRANASRSCLNDTLFAGARQAYMCKRFVVSTKKKNTQRHTLSAGGRQA